MRLNGASALCYDDNNHTVAELAIGLKVSRQLEEGSAVDPVIVPMVAAVIDGDEAVLETSSFVYTMQFVKGVDVIYPLVRREMKIPKGGRIILALTPALLGE